MAAQSHSLLVNGYMVGKYSGLSKNAVLIYQDTYIMGGKGFMGNADVEVPEKYFTIK